MKEWIKDIYYLVIKLRHNMDDYMVYKFMNDYEDAVVMNKRFSKKDSNDETIDEFIDNLQIVLRKK